jgi:hypothetical protein
MAAYVVEAAQDAIGPAYYNNGLGGDSGAHVLTRFFYLIDAAYQLPGLAEDGLRFQVCDPAVYVPGGGDGESLG